MFCEWECQTNPALSGITRVMYLIEFCNVDSISNYCKAYEGQELLRGRRTRNVECMTWYIHPPLEYCLLIFQRMYPAIYPIDNGSSLTRQYKRNML